MLKYLIALVMMTGTVLAAEPSPDSYPKGQLPDTVQPTHYSLDLTVIPTKDTFGGKVVIDVAFKDQGTTLWMHGKGLTVGSVTVEDASGTPISATWAEIPDSDGVAKVTLARAPQAGNGRISIAYTAPFNRQLEGLYRVDDSGESYALSQMEPISARVAFPGFDEPRFKTPYDVALTVRATDHAIANGREIQSQDLPDGMKRVQFATTKPLPTYLVALLVGPFDVVDGPALAPNAIRKTPVPLRGVAVKGRGPQLTYALEHTGPLLAALENYFGIPYPFEKLDIIAAPDFSAGAMENAGAIVYRDSLLLMDEHASLAQKRRYVITHAHEMAHQWVGDLVTPIWWNDIWLNEAFATWMSNKVAATVEPKGEYDRLTLRDALGAMNTDSRTTARSIAQPIASNDDIDNAFDSITYEKGGGVLAMFEQYYGPESFQKGVQLYLQRHSFGNATSKDLLAALAEAGNKSKGAEAFESFLSQPGVPVISVALECKDDTAELSVTQNRYLPLLKEAAPKETQELWKVPLCVAYGDDTMRGENCGLLEDRKARIYLGPRCPTWVMPNADGAGYYRFALGRGDWMHLARSGARLSEKEILATLDSLEAAFMADNLDAGEYFDAVKELANTKSGTMTWDSAQTLSQDLTGITERFVSESSESGARKYVRDLFGPLYRKMGLDATTPMDRENPEGATLLRGPAVRMMALEGRSPDARRDLRRRGTAYLGLSFDGKTDDGKLHPEAVGPDLVDAALTVTVEDAGAPAVQAIFTRLKTERDGSTRGRLLGALTHTTDKRLAAEVRALALSGTLRVNEVPILVYAGMGERKTKADAWAWFKANYATIAEHMPTFGRSGLVGIGGRFCTPAERNDYKAFFQDKVANLTGAPRIYNNVLETIDHCIAMATAQRANADVYFEHYGDSSPRPNP